MPLPPEPPEPPGLHSRPGPPAAWSRCVASALVTTLLLGLDGCAWLPPRPAPPAPSPVQPPPPPPPPPVAVFIPPPAPAPAPPAPPPPADTAARRLLAWQDRLRDLGAADIAREAQRLELAVRQPDGAEAAAATLELALLLGQTRHNGDLARALALADSLARNDSAPTWQALARLLQARLAEQRRLEEQLDRQAQQLRDQQRRLDQLSSQLEALKAIERSLNTRPPAQSQAPGPGTATGRNPP